MTTELEGTVALVTGASSGIGEATAYTLAAHGAKVALLARRRDRLQQVADTITASGGTALPLEVDITKPDQTSAAIEQIVAELGRLDTVINNAGLMLIGPVADASPDEWEQMLAVNVSGVLHVIRTALPHLIRAAQDAPRHVADLVNISSTAGRVARPGTAVYSLTKFGVNALTEALRQEVLSQRVRVSVIGPGTVDTELATHVREDLRESIARQTKGMEKLRAQDIADTIAFIVTRDRRVSVNEILIRASEQTW